MTVPSAYLTSTKNLSGILNSIVGAQAPDKFTTRFLESLDYKSNSDRLVIGVLKALGFLLDDGRPTQRYYQYLDQTQSGRVLAEGIREAYSSLFQVNRNAQKMSSSEVTNKLKTLSQGQYSPSVLSKMASTFVALCGLADFSGSPKPSEEVQDAESVDSGSPHGEDHLVEEAQGPLRIGGLVYNIELVLPESRDPKVYDALFSALRKHLA